MLSAQKIVEGPLVVGGSSDIHGSVLNDTVVQRNSSLHILGDLKGSLTIEPGASVVVEGSVHGKVINKGGRLVVNHRAIAEFVKAEGPPESEAGGILKIDLTAIASNWKALAGRTESECAAVVRADAYGCGIEPATAALAEAGCQTFFVSDLAEAKRARATAPSSTIYVLNGFYAGTAPIFAKFNARPVINSSIEMAEWDFFVTSSQWNGGFALNVVTGASRLGLSLEEAAGIATRVRSSSHGIALVMSALDPPEQSKHPNYDRQLGTFHDVRRLYAGVPASLANSAGIFVGPKAHFNLVRPGAALFGVNPTPGARNPMAPVIELHARIVQVRNLVRGESVAYSNAWAARRAMRVALVSVGYADGFPRLGNPADANMQALVAGKLCRIAGPVAMDLLAIDVTDLPDPAAAGQGKMVTLIGGEIGVDALAAAAKSNGGEVLSNLGRRFHRVYHAS